LQKVNGQLNTERIALNSIGYYPVALEYSNKSLKLVKTLGYFRNILELNSVSEEVEIVRTAQQTTVLATDRCGFIGSHLVEARASVYKPIH
jgi:hypothetical protein